MAIENKYKPQKNINNLLKTTNIYYGKRVFSQCR